MPGNLNSRATSLGYGGKSMGLQNKKYVPGVGTYTLRHEINPELDRQNSFTFGVSREVRFDLGSAWNREDLWVR
jgi:hypothetical protein